LPRDCSVQANILSYEKNEVEVFRERRLLPRVFATVYLLPVYGTDTKWYKHLQQNIKSNYQLEEKKVRAQAQTLVDAQDIADVTYRFRSKYGQLERYYRKLDVSVAVTI
jgi:hypothetical protein